MRDLSNLNKLEQYLVEHNIPYERIDKEDKPFDDEHKYFLVGLEQHQICVPHKGEGCEWDAICHYGSYGAERGLLEIMGNIVDPLAGDSVEGWLTADDVISRIERVKMEMKQNDA